MTDAEVRKKYREIKTNSNSILRDDEGGPAPGGSRLLQRFRSKVRSVIVLDNLVKYKQVTSQFREINRYFVCYIDEWPT